MTLKINDRVVEATTTTGTGALSLGGAVTGYQRFGAVLSVGDTCYYTIEAVDANGIPTGDWETGLGTYSALNTLTRTTVTASSNSGSAVSFASGSKRVFLNLIAAQLSKLSGGYEGIGDLNSVAALTKLAGASGNLTLTDGNKAHLVSWSASGANTIQLADKAQAAGAFTQYLRFIPGLFNVNVQFGLIGRNSSSGKLILLSLNQTSTLSVQEWTNPSTFSATIGSISTGSFANIPLWLKMDSDGTTLTMSYGYNGTDWILLFTRTIATFLGSIDRIGLGGVQQSAGNATVSNFGQVTPA